jgi:hypothetical protein
MKRKQVSKKLDGYEYDEFQVSRGESALGELNKRGAEGWRLVHVRHEARSWDDYVEGRELSGVDHFEHYLLERSKLWQA